MGKKIRIQKNNKYRVLVTEILPYEVPMIFSNDGFYVVAGNDKCTNYFNRMLESYKKEAFGGIPFNYEIDKISGGGTRTLSVIHPYNQLAFIDLYEKYHSLMLYLCSRSPISLRRISKVASFYYSPHFVFEENPYRDEDVEVEPEMLDKETKYIKSYFTYKPIDLIYKFYESRDFQKFEQRFEYMMTFDINKCFYNIYTHSIAWAVKDKTNSKQNINNKKSFEACFDKIMQRSNYNETNGIVVGPEVSRIFAEIILQRVDIDAINILEEKHKYKLGKHYEVRRYVDDYFVFANDKDCLNNIKDVFKDNLSKYKLYINQSKSDVLTSPFITNIYIGKREIKQRLVSLFDSIIEEDINNNISDKRKRLVVKKHDALSQGFIKDFQCIAKKNNLTYDVISKDVIRFLKGKLSKVLKDDRYIKGENDFQNFLLVVFDILLYSYSWCISANTTFKVAQTIVLICKYFEKNENNAIKYSVYSKIAKDINSIFTIVQSKTKYKNGNNVDVLNILIAMKKLGKTYLLSVEKIEKIFCLNNDVEYDNLNYFQIITLLCYIEDNNTYDDIKKKIENAIIKKYAKGKGVFIESELTMLFFDILCCPFISNSVKKKLIAHTGFCKKNESMDNKIKEISNHKKWFVDWDTEIDLERILKKKEWGSSY